MTPLDPDPLTILPPDPPTRRGCVSVLPFLLILFLASLAPAPSGALNDPALPPAALSVPRGAPLAGVAQLAERHLKVEVAGSNPVPGGQRAYGGAPPTPYRASASWCAPTATQCQSWGPPAKLAAVHSFRYGDRPYWVRIWRGSAFVDVKVVSFCQCNGREDAIDLSPFAFEKLAPLSRGRVWVIVTDLAAANEPLPATDSEGE